MNATGGKESPSRVLCMCRPAGSLASGHLDIGSAGRHSLYIVPFGVRMMLVLRLPAEKRCKMELVRAKTNPLRPYHSHKRCDEESYR